VWFSKEAIEAGIAPGGFAIRLRGERHARRHAGYATGDWAGALAELETMLRSHRPTGARSRLGRPALSVALSLGYARFFRLPWSEPLLKRGRWAAFAAAQFAAQFASASSGSGAAPDSFSFLVEDAPPGAPRLACAIEHALLVALNELARRTNTRLISASPWIAAAINLHARHLPADGWFAAIEDGHLALVMLSEGVAREIAIAPWPDETSSRHPGTPSDWRISLARLECRMRLRSARPAGLPLILLDASGRGAVSGPTDLADLPLVTFAAAEHVAMPERTEAPSTELGVAHLSFALPGAAA